MPVSPAASLIAPDNRLLGWGLTDLTLYGAQPLPGMIVSPADKGDASIAPPAEAVENSPKPIASDVSEAEHDLAFDAGSAPATASASAPLTPTTLQATSSLHPLGAPSVPPPLGSGTAAQPSVATPLQTVAQHSHDATGDQAAVSASQAFSPATVAALPGPEAITAATPTFAPLIEVAEAATHTASGAAGPLTSVAVGEVGHSLADTTGVIGATTAEVVNTLAVAPAAAPAPVADVLGIAAGALAPATLTLAAPVIETAGAVTSTVDVIAPIAVTPLVETIAQPPIAAAAPADAVGHAGDLVAGTGTGLVDALAGAPAPTHIADAPTATVNGLVGDVAAATPSSADMHGLGGSDPAGGITTLVGMMASADAFDLSHTSAPAAASPPSLVDALAADEVPPALLGDHHADGDAGHATDDHGVHLGL